MSYELEPSDWEQVRHYAPSPSYIELISNYRSVYATQTIMGPVGEDLLLLDWAEDGTLLGIELMIPGVLVYDKLREEINSD